jgi:L-ascorbate metabolism protein UlaG (beta-lactamase superfamily)
LTAPAQRAMLDGNKPGLTGADILWKEAAVMETTAFLLTATLVLAQNAAPNDGTELKKDRIETPAGQIVITFIGHGTLMLEFDGKTVHVDPWSKLTDYAKLPKADVLLITHDHRDHLDAKAIAAVRTDDTTLILPEVCAEKLKGGLVMKSGQKRTVAGIQVEAVPAYNMVHRRPDGDFYHPKGVGIGYVLTLGKTRVYVAGDTENTPEMKALKDINIAFLPMNLPYTMTPAMVADAAKAFRPKILYPYHTGDTDVSQLAELLKDTPDVELRLRPMK